MKPPPVVGRFAPSTTGPAHPGTLLSALLCWLDARSQQGRVLLRLEDLDPQRCRPELADALKRDLAWLGLDWDGVSLQSEQRQQHHDALDRLAEAGRLYPCACSRTRIREASLPAPGGGYRYPNSCRGRALPAGGWRACTEPLRAQLDEGVIEVTDGSGADLSGDPARDAGDPVVRRRDGAVAYHLASVVDDAASGVTRVVRGNDLAPSTATQAALGGLLGFRRPAYHHHFLLLERPAGGKLAKLHGSLPIDELRRHLDAEALVGTLAAISGLALDDTGTSPRALLAGFDWQKVPREDRVLELREGRLAVAPVG